MGIRTHVLIPFCVFFLSVLAPGGLLAPGFRDGTYAAVSAEADGGQQQDAPANAAGQEETQAAALSGIEETGKTESPSAETEDDGTAPDAGRTEAEAVSEQESGAGHGSMPETAPAAVPAKEEEPLAIIAVGDVMLGRGVGSRLEKGSLGYLYPFEKVRELLGEGDVVFANLEQPVTDSTHSLDKRYKYVLKSGTNAFEAIRSAGFNMLSLANNHIMDYYDTGLHDTVDILDKNGIAHSGAGKNLDEARKAAILEAKGVTVGLLSYTDMAEYVYRGDPNISFEAGADKAGVAPRKIEYIEEDIKGIRDQVDILMVSLHWGIEESFDVEPRQTEFAHRLIDGGADIVLGHHPHQFQGMELYKGKPVIYSMGNFIFDQNDPENQEGFIINMKYRDNLLEAMTAIPVRTVSKSQVVPLSGESAAALLEREKKLCSMFGTGCEINGDRLVIKLK